MLTRRKFIKFIGVVGLGYFIPPPLMNYPPVQDINNATYSCWTAKVPGGKPAVLTLEMLQKAMDQCKRYN